MKQATMTIEKALRNGLRRYSNNPRNVPGLTECFNLAPGEQGLEEHETITSLGATGVSWGGEGVYSAGAVTRTITIRVTDYVDDSELQTVAVTLDGVGKGNTNADGELSIGDVTIGGHELKLTKTGYVDSDLDTIFNDNIMII